MRSRSTSWPTVICALLACIIMMLSGCDLPGATGSASSTPGEGAGATATGGSSGSARATATPTSPPPSRALAWFQQDSHQVGQIWASVNGGAAHQVTHMPASTAECRYDAYWSSPVFSPDLSKIVAAWGSDACTDGPEHGPVYVINASTGAATQAPSSDNRLSLRDAGWINNSTIWWSDGRILHQYVVGGGGSVLGTLTSSSYSDDAVLRGNTLFFTVASGSGYLLKRFNMTSHTVLAGSVNMGTTNPCECSRNDALSPGFDVSPDGSHIVYQKTAPASGTSGDAEGVTSSQFFYANADGSGASRIASVATAASMVKMQISPNGHLVAVARAEPVPSVFTASVTSAGLSGDPNMRFYTPDAGSYPVWKYDNVTFWAGTGHPDMEHFDLGVGAGSVGAAGGGNPWYTIGS